jgi:hypothetical protein
MFNAARGQIVYPGDVPLAEDSSSLSPLRDLLVATDFPYKNGDFEKVDPKLWDRDCCLELGRLVVAAIERDGERRSMTRLHISRLEILGQAPGQKLFYEFFDNFSNFKREVGSPIRYDRVLYADWGINEVVQYAEQTKKELGRLPIIADYQQLFNEGRGPSFALIEARARGIRKLNDRLGYPDTKDWEKIDFVDWGVDVMSANPGNDFSLNLIDALAAEGRGPSQHTIKRCVRWSSLRKEVENEFQTRPEVKRQERTAKLRQYRSMIEQGTMPINSIAITDDELLSVGARYAVIQDCAADLAVDRKLRICSVPPDRFVRYLRRSRPTLSAGDIELAAILLNLFDDIWPVDGSIEHLYVPQGRIDEIRIAKSLVRTRIRAKHAAERTV